MTTRKLAKFSRVPIAMAVATAAEGLALAIDLTVMIAMSVARAESL